MALVVKNLPANAGDRDVGPIQRLGRGGRNGESYGQRSLARYSLWSSLESDTTEQVTCSWRRGAVGR